ncbi:MAG: helix-turn-helix domain-containing protein [Chloroflexi bacterium]|nr:helix-turn-helix domain-containing protein [Chloroflexota bacterium]
MNKDYAERTYLSVVEVASLTGLDVKRLHELARSKQLPAIKSTSGQYRFRLADISRFRQQAPVDSAGSHHTVHCKDTVQEIVTGDARAMSQVDDCSVHLAVTSPPYFNAKMYSDAEHGDLANIHDLDEWMAETSRVWAEVLRVLQPGRKFFLNIMNLPIRVDGTFRTLNLVGKTIDACERLGFVFKRDIGWHKTNGVRAHFGTYPYPGGILLNHMHEFILELEKPAAKNHRKYGHVSDEERARSKLDKDFWLSLKNSDVWLMKPEASGRNRKHAAPFPLELPERFIRAYSFVGERVLDPFLGSGTTLLAAALHGRNGIGYDINADFCELAKKRLAENLI